MATGTDAGPAAAIAAAALLRGIGTNAATLSVNEFFCPHLRNRREFASWASLTAQWASGDLERNQWKGRYGPTWVRAHLVQMAWRWLQFQPDNALSQWFEARTTGAGALRKIMITPLARKLLIALWRLSKRVSCRPAPGWPDGKALDLPGSPDAVGAGPGGV